MPDTEPLIILGPTAVGKSALGLELARRHGGEIVSLDSMQVYRGMDIGTAKPTAAEREACPHHVIDCRDVTEDWDVARHIAAVRAAEEDIQMRGRLPILVGGTALYIKALVDGLSEELPGSDTVRAELAAEAGRRGAARLHAEELMQVDPESAARIHPNDKRRIIRALEVYRMTGRPMSELQTQWRADSDTHYRMIGLTMPREQLYARIDARVHAMMDAGLVAEVRRVQALGVEKNASAAGAIGYAEILAYLAGAHDRDRAVELIQRNTRRFAKHQLTWFRGDARIAWFDVNAYARIDMLADAVEYFLVTGGPTAEPPPRLT